MKANAFYLNESADAVPLLFLNEDVLGQYLSDASPLEQNLIQSQQFRGKSGELCLMTNAEGVLQKVYLGFEKNNKAQALAHAALKCPPLIYRLNEPLDTQELIHWGLAQYRFDAYKASTLQPRRLLLADSMCLSVTQWVDALFVVRDLINRPMNDLGPEELASFTAELAKTYGAEFKQWVGDELLRENFPAIHAVGRASAAAPRLLSLTWGREQDPLVTLVGKGVCFDSGGLDLKPASAMRLMKKDMGGAAQVLGLAQWIMSQKLALRLQIYIPAVENAIGSNAFRPGDILTMRNGLTVEVDNTDAEGRLVLADAMSLACEDNPKLLIDFSTLTGAARVAVGTDISAMFSNDDAVAQGLLAASIKTVDALWRLPLFEAYEPMLQSKVADLSNSSDSPYAGAITAALFLKHFVKAEIPWVHFDVMAWNLSSKPGKPEGGEAMGIRAVAEYLTHWLVEP